MQDYNYWTHGCYEITIELSCCKYPPANQLEQIWLQNKKSLIEYLKLVGVGVRGVVSYANGQPAENVTVEIDSREPYFKTNKRGEYYRILLPGVYRIFLLFNCEQIYESEFRITNGFLVLNITLPESKLNVSNQYTLSKTPVYCSKKPLKCLNYKGIVTGNVASTLNGISIRILTAAIFYLFYNP